MIYTRISKMKVQILADCGLHTGQKHEKGKTRLLLCLVFGDGKEREAYRWENHLEADRGNGEIEKAISKANKVNLNSAELSKAINSAV